MCAGRAGDLDVLSTSVVSGWYTTAIGFTSSGVLADNIEGVPVASLDYLVSGVKYVGFQGNGIANDFLVQAGAITVP